MIYRSRELERIKCGVWYPPQSGEMNDDMGTGGLDMDRSKRGAVASRSLKFRLGVA